MLMVVASADKNRTVFVSSSLIFKPFIYFSCPVALVRTSSIMLNNGQNRYFFLEFLSFREESLQFFTSYRSFEDATDQVEKVLYSSFPKIIFIYLFKRKKIQKRKTKAKQTNKQQAQSNNSISFQRKIRI